MQTQWIKISKNSYMQAGVSLAHGLGRFPSLKYFLNLTDPD